MIKLLITGEMRSGTTLLANLLNAQEGVDINRDFLLIDRLKRRINAGWTTQLTDQQRRRLVSLFQIDGAEMNAAFDVTSDSFTTIAGFYEHVLDCLAGKGTRVVGHKVTVAYESIPELLELVPDLHVLFVIRDPRDMIVSALRRWRSQDAFKLARRWQASSGMVRVLCEKERFRDRLLICKYEDLVMNTTGELVRISQFIHVPDLSVPSKLEDYGKPWHGNSSFGELGCLVDSSPVGRWRSVAPRLGKRIELLLGKSLTEYGYDTSSDVGLQDRIGFQIRYLFYRALFRLRTATMRTARRSERCFVKLMARVANDYPEARDTS